MVSTHGLRPRLWLLMSRNISLAIFGHRRQKKDTVYNAWSPMDSWLGAKLDYLVSQYFGNIFIISPLKDNINN